MTNLNKLYWIKKEIRQLENRIKELTYLSAVSMNGMPKGSGVNSPVEKLYDQIEKLKEKLDFKKANLIAEEERLEKILDTIEDDEVRVYARGRFIECKSYEQIGNENFVDRTTVSKKLRQYVEGSNTNECGCVNIGR